MSPCVGVFVILLFVARIKYKSLTMRLRCFHTLKNIFIFQRGKIRITGLIYIGKYILMEKLNFCLFIYFYYLFKFHTIFLMY